MAEESLLENWGSIHTTQRASMAHLGARSGTCRACNGAAFRRSPFIMPAPPLRALLLAAAGAAAPAAPLPAAD